ncbi:MAG: hypothetical protein LBJ08_00340 [Bifidobacteriaceae bacterium]|jgi:O-antigen/teichoic acid export membrane protein|nr:hypothetical protein [Bifidobacteriaceae bacterium]
MSKRRRAWNWVAGCAFVLLTALAAVTRPCGVHLPDDFRSPVVLTLLVWCVVLRCSLHQTYPNRRAYRFPGSSLVTTASLGVMAVVTLTPDTWSRKAGLLAFVAVAAFAASLIQALQSYRDASQLKSKKYKRKARGRRTVMWAWLAFCVTSLILMGGEGVPFLQGPFAFTGMLGCLVLTRRELVHWPQFRRLRRGARRKLNQLIDRFGPSWS